MTILSVPDCVATPGAEQANRHVQCFSFTLFCSGFGTLSGSGHRLEAWGPGRNETHVKKFKGQVYKQTTNCLWLSHSLTQTHNSNKMSSVSNQVDPKPDVVYKKYHRIVQICVDASSCCVPLNIFWSKALHLMSYYIYMWLALLFQSYETSLTHTHTRNLY